MNSAHLRNRATGWIAGAGALIALSALTACSEDSTAQRADSSSTGSPSAEAGSTTAAGTPAKEQTGGQATVQDAVAGWVTAIVKDRPEDACLAMGTPATGSSPARANTAATCSGSGSQVQQMEQQIHSLHTSFTPKSSTGDPTVQVGQVQATGKTAVVPGDRITVGGQTLTAVLLSNSTGVQKDQVGLKVDATDIDGSWYVTDLHLSVG